MNKKNVSKWVDVYNHDGKTNIYFLQGKKGVYLIRSKRSKKILYVGKSEHDLYKIILRKFQKWDDREQDRNFFKQKANYQVRVILTDSKKNIDWLEKMLILKHQPKFNKFSYVGTTKNYAVADKREIYKQLLAEEPEQNIRQFLSFL